MRIRDIALTVNDRYYAFAAWGVLLAFYHGIYRGFFPNAHGALGHDFGLGLAGVVDGFIWFAKNGPLVVPWFTPSFCGGVPFFADPQSGYYSVPQWLTLVLDPLTAAYLTLLLFASLGYCGMYILTRRGFGLSASWSIFAAALYFFNTFLPHRAIIGEYGYCGLTLAPWLVWFLIRPASHVTSRLGLAMLSGMIAAYWLQSGLTTLMIPAALSVALVLLAYRLRRPWPSDLPVRMLTAIGISVVLSASKLVAGLSFYRQFERTQYLLPGFDNPLALLRAGIIALFGRSEGAYSVGAESLVNVQWTLLPHEWAYGFTLAPLLAIPAARLLARLPAKHPPPDRHVAATGAAAPIAAGVKWVVIPAIAVIALIPLAYQFYTPALNAWYKALPLLGATAAPMRWLIIYLPILPIAVVLRARLALGGRQDLAPWLVGGAICVLVGFNLFDPRPYYADQSYRPDRILAGYARLAAGGVQGHRITAVGNMTDPKTGALVVDEGRNDIMVDGISQAQCYNPAFGYRLEKFPRGRLVLGDVMAEHDGYLNIKNPACYVFPAENRCAPGDHFRVTEREKAQAFVSYTPFAFEKSRAQQIAEVITMAGLIAVSAFLLLVWPWFAWRRRSAAARR